MYIYYFRNIRGGVNRFRELLCAVECCATQHIRMVSATVVLLFHCGVFIYMLCIYIYFGFLFVLRVFCLMCFMFFVCFRQLCLIFWFHPFILTLFAMYMKPFITANSLCQNFFSVASLPFAGLCILPLIFKFLAQERSGMSIHKTLKP